MSNQMKNLVSDLPDKEYHGGPGVSSSQLKDLLEDPEIFYRKYISKEQPREELAAFDIGTYFHTAILEPEKLEATTTVFPGIRRGKKWEEFQEANKDKLILTESGAKAAENLISAVKKSVLANDLISQCEAEVSAYLRVLVGIDGKIYAPDYCTVLNIDEGWVEMGPEKPETIGEVTLKVRADALGPDFILDLKSTTGNVRKEGSIRRKISDYHYDLSASLYLDIFSLVSDRPLSGFIWTFASKDMGTCQNYLASPQNIKVGRAKWAYAVVKLVENIKNDWRFPDEIREVSPMLHEVEWITKAKSVTPEILGEELL